MHGSKVTGGLFFAEFASHGSSVMVCCIGTLAWMGVFAGVQRISCSYSGMGGGYRVSLFPRSSCHCVHQINQILSSQNNQDDKDDIDI